MNACVERKVGISVLKYWFSSEYDFVFPKEGCVSIYLFSAICECYLLSFLFLSSPLLWKDLIVLFLKTSIRGCIFVSLVPVFNSFSCRVLRPLITFRILFGSSKIIPFY